MKHGPIRAKRARAFLAALLCLPAFGGAMELVHSERSLYRQVLVYEDAGRRYLCFTRNCNIGRQTGMQIAAPRQLVFEYTRMMMSALWLQPRPATILVIGLGGGTLPSALARLLPDARIDVVEIDPAVTRVARNYFGFRSGPRLTVHEEDGRTYVRRAVRTGLHYDLIMLDAYDNVYIPEHLLTVEFLREVRELLPEGGVLAANTFSSSRLYDSESVTYQTVYGPFYNLKSGNRIILACRGRLTAMDIVRANSVRSTAAFAELGIEADRLLARFSTQVDWNGSARRLTDQFSPANLLNGRQARSGQ